MDPTAFSYLLKVIDIQYEVDCLVGIDDHSKSSTWFMDSGLGEVAYQGGMTSTVPAVPSSVGQADSASASKSHVRLSAEERKEKIHRYLKKRNERNFAKKIKYACRKTLADCRPRIRGRFAKNEETVTVTPNYSLNNEYINIGDEHNVELEEDSMFESSDILALISGINSSSYQYSWK